MLYASPGDFCAKYAEAHGHDKDDGYGQTSALGEVTVVSETPDTARVEVLWHTFGHAPDAGYYEGFERTAIVLVKQHDGWRLHTVENLGYEW